MKETRHSKQRDAVLEYLRSTKTHPTAESVHIKLREQIPNISLGTVYRNLSQLEEMGLVRKIVQGTEPDRYDADTSPHSHLKCHSCGSVSDIFIDPGDLDLLAAASCGGNIEGHDIMFYGVCANCKKDL